MPQVAPPPDTTITTAPHAPRGTTRLTRDTPFGRMYLVLPDLAVEHAPAALDAADAWCALVDASDPDSELSRLNAVGAGIVSPVLAQALGAALLAAYHTAGALSPLADPCDGGDASWKAIRIDDRGKVIVPDARRLDLIQIAPGLLSDRVAGVLRRAGVACGLVQVADTTVVWGACPTGRGWRVGGGDAPTLQLRWGALASSRSATGIAHVVAPRGEDATTLSVGAARSAPAASRSLLRCHGAPAIITDENGHTVTIGAWPEQAETAVATSDVPNAA